MKKFLIAALFLIAPGAWADHDAKVAKDVGSYVATAVVTAASNTGTAFLSPDLKRMDAILFNNTSAAVWIGTTSATIDRNTHSNISMGIPILSSATFSLNGVMSDALYVTCNPGTAACAVRVLEGKNR